ncbi:MAG TPA: ABC transporter permease [Syntrophorhabdaceae bacterium]|nr:ABC transporter permease [Syntrophorhabdaceae bacterium]
MNKTSVVKTGQKREVWRRLKRNRAAVTGGVILLVFLVVSLLGPLIAPYPANEGDLTKRLEAPSRAHLLGTDALGRDLLSRVICGARISLEIQIAAVMIALIIGTIIGMIGGYYGGAIDHTIMRVMDILLAFPGIFLAIAIVAVLGTGLTNLIFAAGIYSIPQFARVVRGSVITLKEREFVEAARVAGETDTNILARYILPNSMAPLIVQTTLRMATVLLTASGLSFLGLGVQPPAPEWGAMLSNSRDYLVTAPHAAIVPGFAIMLVVMGFNLFGDGLRDSLDPRLRD